VARKNRASTRRGRAPSRGLLIGITLALIGVAFLIARVRPPLRPAPPEAAAVEVPEDARPIPIDSDWDRLRLRVRSEYLRTFRAGDRAALLRLTSRTLRSALEEVGVGQDRIDERPAAAAAAGAGRAPVQWRIQVPRRASLFRINDAISQAILTLGGQVLRGVERPAQKAGTLLDLRVGYRGEATHAIVVEPTDELTDADAKIAIVVTDLDRDSGALYASFLRSPIPLSIAVRPDRPGVARMARELRTANREVLLQLPMEPKGYPRVDPGKDAILLDLSRFEIEDRISRCLSSVGPVQGVITRLGSATVNDPDVMRTVLGEMKRRDLPFFDAHGAGPSVVEEVGEEIGARTITLGGSFDGVAATTTAVRARLRELVATAAQRGALVVGLRANSLVLTVLEADRAKLLEQGVELVAASRLAL
jgi:uncharacterized protein